MFFDFGESDDAEGCFSHGVLNTTSSKKNQRPLAGPVFTTVPIEIPPVNQVANPIWIRLPKVGKSCPFTGLSRSTLNNLILGKNPPVQSVSLRQHHAIRGCRIILLKSLLEFIAGVAAAQNPTNSAHASADVEEVDHTTRCAAKNKPRATRNKQ